MRATRSVKADDGFVLTEQGRYDLHMARQCLCNPKLVGLLIECPECGTIYGTLRDSASWGQQRSRPKD